MLTNEIRLRAERQVKNLTTQYKQGKAAGYDIVSMGLPSFESQEDHDRYHPDDAGQDFREHNDFAAEILKGLRANGVPAELVTIRYDAYAKWLSGRKNTSEARAEYEAHLAADADAAKPEMIQ
jgi:hypothetical protein